jgi:hypothetical protein
MAKAFSDATGADFAAKMAARKVVYTTAVGGQVRKTPSWSRSWVNFSPL